MRKYNAMILCWFSLLLVLLVGPIEGHSKATDVQQQTVYLHKRSYQYGQLPSEVSASGELITENHPNASMLTATTGINGVTFTVLDITEYVRTHPESAEKAFNTAKEMNPAIVADIQIGAPISNYAGMTVVARGTTEEQLITDDRGNPVNESGVMQVTLPKKHGTADAVYLFVETKVAVGITSSIPFILSFPIIDEATNQEWRDALHIYPKGESELEQPMEPTILKTLMEEKQDFAYGEEISYKVTVSIPKDIDRYTKFQIIDNPDSCLKANLKSIKVRLSGVPDERIGQYYTGPVAQENGFLIEFLPAMLAEHHAGEMIEILVSMEIVSNAIPDTGFVNTARLIYNDSEQEHEIESPSAEVCTGGYRFIKSDAVDQEKVLEQASFVIKNSENCYLTKEYQWKSTRAPSVDTDLLVLSSDITGCFEITGLAYDTYYLQEIIAPKGYALPTYTIEFKVAKNTYSIHGQPVDKLQILNRKLADTGSSSREEKSTSSLLPNTGEFVRYTSLFLGLALIAAVVQLSVFNKKQQQ